MSLQLDKILEMLSYWRVIFVLGAMALLCFWVMGMLRVVPLTSWEKWQVPTVGVLALAMGLYWLANQPPPRQAVAGEVVQRGEGMWKEKVLADRYAALSAQKLPPGNFVLLKIPEINASGLSRREVMPRTSIMELTGGTLFAHNPDGTFIKVSEAVRHGRGLHVPLETLKDQRITDGYLLLSYKDKPIPSDEQLSHLIALK